MYHENESSEIEKINIILCNFNPLMRMGLRTCIGSHRDMVITAEGGDHGEAIDLAKRLHADIIIMGEEFHIAGINKAIEQIRQECPDTKILVLLDQADNSKLSAVKQSGANSALNKIVSYDAFIRTIRQVVAGAYFFDAVMPHNAPSTEPLTKTRSLPGAQSNMLTVKELSIIKLVAKGMSNKKIANELGLSLSNIKVSLTTIFIKLHASSRTEMVSISLNNGIISPDDLVK